MIRAINISKIYKVKTKTKTGLKESFKSVFHPSYTDVNALTNVSFSIKKGERVGIIGGNGAGKTTLIKLLSGIIYPTSGKILVNGFIPQERKKDYLTKISFLMGQRSQLWIDLSPMDNYDVIANIYSADKKDWTDMVDELSTLLNIKEKLNVPIRQLSLGQKMKCELIASLIYRPESIFLDEPTLGLDIPTQRNIRKFITEYCDRHGATLLMTSHYIEDIKKVCDRIILITKGEIALDSSLNEIEKHYLPEKWIEIKPAELIPPELHGAINSRWPTHLSKNKLIVKCKTEELLEATNYLLRLKTSSMEHFSVEIKDTSLEDFIHDFMVRGTC